MYNRFLLLFTFTHQYYVRDVAARILYYVLTDVISEMKKKKKTLKTLKSLGGGGRGDTLRFHDVASAAAAVVDVAIIILLLLKRRSVTNLNDVYLYSVLLF